MSGPSPAREVESGARFGDNDRQPAAPPQDATLGNHIPIGALAQSAPNRQSIERLPSKFDNVLRRDRVTGNHLLPGEPETRHDTMTGVTSPFWAPRKGAEFTNLVTRVFGGAPETASAKPIKLADSAPAQPADQVQGGTKPVEPDTRSGDPPSSGSKKDEIEWVPEPIHTAKGDRVIRVKGPVKIEARSSALGLDGLDYRVIWHPLDKDGNVMPTFRNPEGDTPRTGEYTGLNIPGKTIHQPPYDNPHGFEVRISVPPQPPSHGNTSGAQLDVFVPKGGKIK